ncbi:MAG: LysM peptidoglycan-binding domain-containing protein [Bacteroidota bacterium]
MFYSRKYQVKAGDTLTHIAKTFGLPSWRNIYDAPDNARLKRLRGTPDNLQVGDMLSIPPNPIEVLEYQLGRLTKIRLESIEMFDNLLYTAKRDHQSIKRVAGNADMAAAVFQLGMGYAKIVKGGLDTIKLTGQELMKANQQLAKSAVTTGPKFVAEQVVQKSSILEVTGEEGLALAIPKIIVKSWFDMTSPSYWAQRFSGINIERLHEQTNRHILNAKRQSIQNLDKRISEIRSEILRQRSLKSQ